MRALLKPSRWPRPVPHQQLRTLRTRPARIPKYRTTWDPSTQVQESDGGARTPAFSFAIFKEQRHHANTKRGLTVDDEIGRQHAIRRLEQCVSLAQSGSSAWELRRPLWRAYSLAKSHDPELLQTLSEKMWYSLWTSPSIRLRQNRHSRAHVIELYKDMVAAGVVPTTSQTVHYLESMFLNGMEQQALKEWEDICAQSDFEDQMRFQPKFAEGGARMHALAGNLSRAKTIAEKLYDYHPSWDPTVMLAVIRAHTRSKAELHHNHAWDLYEQMKTIPGAHLGTIGFKSCLIGFLEARHLQYARQVFGDMVKHGVLANGDSQTHVYEVRYYLHHLYRLVTDIVQATNVALYALGTLPSAYHVYVFSDWIKLAAWKKAPEAAAQILDLMFKRGFQPSTTNFNYLLRSLFSTRQKPHGLKAENIAWHMVDIASRAASGKAPRKPRPTQSDPLLLQTIPPANAVTFALLIRHHASRSQWEHADYLVRHMQSLGIRKNTEVMNIFLDNLCRKGKYNEVWDTYQSFTSPPKDTPGIFPNGATFRCLWKTLRLALADVQYREESTLPGPRQLLAENIRWWNMVRSRYDASRFRAGLAGEDSGAVNTLIMHCFSYRRDLPGSLVAIHALRSQFHILPSNRAAGILQSQIAWIDFSRENDSARAHYSRSGLHKQKLQQLEKAYDILWDDRLARMGISEKEFASLDPERMADIKLNSLSEFIRAFLRRKQSPQDVEAMIEKAKNDIGMPNLPTGDMDAFTVA